MTDINHLISLLALEEAAKDIMAYAAAGGVVGEEKRGQAMVVTSDVIPKMTSFPQSPIDRPALERFGFVFGEDVDDLFVRVQLPAGWAKRKTDHDMSSEIVDERGQVRAVIFYKAAFYDRRADIRFIPRYVIETMYSLDAGQTWATDYVGLHDHPRPLEIQVHHRVMDLVTGEAVFTSAPWNYCVEKKTSVGEVYIGFADTDPAAQRWLDATYPDHDDPFAYWPTE